VLERETRDELDGLDGALGRDAQPREQDEPVRVSRPFDRRDGRDVDTAREQRPAELRRHAGDFLHVRVEGEEDGRHVHVRDAAEPDHRNVPGAARSGRDRHVSGSG
jgi:hypothetical protein